MDRFNDRWNRSEREFRNAMKASTAFRYAVYGVGISLGVSALLGFAALLLQLCGEKIGWPATFLGGIYLNLLAEFFGLGVGLLLAALVARRLAREKLRELAPEVIRLIAYLRDHGTIDGRAARRCVVCTVALLSDDSLELGQGDAPVTRPGFDCPVCALPAPAEPIPGKDSLRCGLCKLESGVWNIKLEPRPTPSEGVPRPESPSP